VVVVARVVVVVVRYGLVHQAQGQVAAAQHGLVHQAQGPVAAQQKLAHQAQGAMLVGQEVEVVEPLAPAQGAKSMSAIRKCER
jgi:hypothetical protein